MIWALEQELLELAAVQDDPDRVIQLNFQLFPLSSGREEEKSQ